MAAAPSTGGKPYHSHGPVIRNDAASGSALRESLFSGTLSAEALHALMHMSSLRQGLIGRPVPHEVRKAVVTTPMNSNLRGVLLSETSLVSSVPMQTASPGRTTPGSGGSAFPEQSTDGRSGHPWSHTGSSKPSATPSRAAGPGQNVAHADAGSLKRKRGWGPSADNSKGPYNTAEAHAPAASETSTPTKHSSFSIASKLVSNLFAVSSNAGPDPLQAGFEGAGEGDGSSTDGVHGYASAEDVFHHHETGTESTKLDDHGQPASKNMITAPGLPWSPMEDSISTPLPDGTPTHANNQCPHPAATLATSTWDIIHPHLGAVPYSPIPQKGHVQGLLPLPRKRKVEFNSQSNRFFVSRAQDISAMIIQITGNEAPSACTRCRQGKGPFVGCVEVCTSAPDEVKHWIKSCANCFYKGNQKYCDLLKLQTVDQSVVPAALLQTPSSVAPESSLTGGTAHRLDGASSQAGDGVPMRGIQAGPCEMPIHETRQLRHSSNASSRGRQPGSHETPTYEPCQLRHKALASPERAQGSGDSTRPNLSVHDEGPGTAEDMGLEEWEIAPGRIRDAASAGIENIAFSSTYLTHSEEVAVNRDVGFHVLVVRAGSTHQWEAITNKLRICSIATGKVKVVMPDREFKIGRNGMFKIKGDTSCTVENLYYGEATIHVCTMPYDYDI